MVSYSSSTTYRDKTRDNKILSLFDSIHSIETSRARLRFRERYVAKEIENREQKCSRFEQKSSSFVPRTKSRIFSISFFLFLYIIICYESWRKEKDRDFCRKKSDSLNLRSDLTLVGNNLVRISSLSWNKRRYSKEHRMCACYTSGPEGRKVVPVLCNRIVWPLWPRVLCKLHEHEHDFSDYIICTYCESNRLFCSWIVERGKEQTKKSRCEIYQSIFMFRILISINPNC